MTEGPNDLDSNALAEPTEREHRDALAALRELDRATTRDWQAVALGQRELDEVAAERASAGEDPESIERAKALFRPYDELEQRRLLDALLTKPAVNDSDRRGMLGLSLVLAAAAAITLGWFALAGSPTSAPRMAAIPHYAIETDGGRTTTRSTAQPDPSLPLRYAAANEFEWILRPRTELVGPAPILDVIARDAQGHTTALALAPELAASGSIRLAGSVAELGLAPGAWTIEFTLRRVTGWHVDALVLTLPLTLEP